MSTISALLMAALLSAPVSNVSTSQQAVSFDSDLWDIQAAEAKVVDHLGRRSLYLKGGLAIVKGSQFADGVIDYDIAVSGERGFMGAVWRLQDRENYEEFYVRPHQSGQPDANQYQPVFNGQAAWQLYYGEGYGAPVTYEYNRWIHVRIVVSGRNAEVFVGDMETPALFVNELKREVRAGAVGLSVGNFAPAYFSNFSFSAAERPALKGSSKPPAATPPGTVTSWRVSAPIHEKSLEGRYRLAASDKPASWAKISAEANGTVNLARLHGVTEERNTVFCRLTIRSDADTVKRLRFGFSDSVRVYFDDQLIYGGNDTYRSRDHRFLGTIGLFDDLYLPLKKGDNELWMAVTESFGGWGITARFDDPSGIRIVE